MRGRPTNSARIPVGPKGRWYYKIRSASFPIVKQEQPPIVLGRDLSGTVETCGTRAHTLKRGDPIYAMIGQSRFRSHLLTEAAAALCFREHLHPFAFRRERNLLQDRGAYAEFVVVKAVEMAAKPDRLSHVEAAGVPRPA